MTDKVGNRLTGYITVTAIVQVGGFRLNEWSHVAVPSNPFTLFDVFYEIREPTEEARNRWKSLREADRKFWA